MKKTSLISFSILFILFILLTQCSFSQSNSRKSRRFFQKTQNPNSYIYPADSSVISKLDWWKGLKVGLMLTWGTYVEWGIIESWTLISEDMSWNHRVGPYADDYAVYKKEYERNQTFFNPVNFNPDTWATAAKNAGIRYVVFTTKHHDGFCMFDTKQTDYSVTDIKCPFSNDPRANITKEVFKAFRNKGIGIGAYFSKPDWYNNNFWWRYFVPGEIYPNYSTTKYPNVWKNFKNFTFNQIKELMIEYGSIDILWLDGGWICPRTPYDINMPAIANMARSYQQGLIMVDRYAVDFEDYLTPEDTIPPAPLGVPWETCRPIAVSWPWTPYNVFKPTFRLIHNLIEVVAKGGNILFATGPDPNGELDTATCNRLQQIGEWMDVNKSGIYETSYTTPFSSPPKIYFTAKNDTMFAFYLADSLQNIIPPQITWNNIYPEANSHVYLLGYEQPLHWTINGNTTTVTIPPNLQTNPPCLYAWTFMFKRGTVNIRNITSEIPKTYKLYQNYPNPFNPSTNINFDLPTGKNVQIKIFDILGKEVTTLANEKLNAGSYSVIWEAVNYPSGTYFCQLKSGNYSEIIKMILIK
ncbi:MAG TPA: alpha-L-fucosidase [Ignavibacteria bacterium]